MDVDATPVPGKHPISADPEATANGGFLLGDLAGPRAILSMGDLIERLTALVRSWEGCEAVTVLEAYRLDRPDSRDGCNWSLSLMLDPAGTAPEVYALGYAYAIAMARARWNLEPEVSVAVVPDPA